MAAASAAMFRSLAAAPPRCGRRARCCFFPAAAAPPPNSLLVSSPPSPSLTIISEIEKSGIIACLRAPDRELAIEAARAALSSGISVLEVVMSTPGALEIVEELVDSYPSSTIGVGTVLNLQDASKAIEAGAKFLMSPGTVLDILNSIEGSGVLYIPGVMTPTEILQAQNCGARMVKIYPISILGGEKYVEVLKRPFPSIPMVASQGITIDSMGRYIRNGASAVVLSDAIFDKSAMRLRHFNAISKFAHLANREAQRAGKQ